MLSIEEFNAAFTACAQRMCVAIVATLISVLLCFIVYLPFKDAIDGFYTRQFGDVTAEALKGMTLLPALIVMFLGLWMTARRTRRDLRLACPHCKKLPIGQRHLVVASRNCGHCGRRVLAEPPTLPDPH